ncbi:hypothetical protein [Halobacteriovorax sp.]|uniref:hypothetical protein n=1 Tax=Halobacteriovorax sp. TaxID=2020862 RepID=UPI003AF2699C
MKFLLILALLTPFISNAEVSKADFEKLIFNIVDIYDKELPAQRNLDINWESETKNASVNFKKGKVNFIFHGGFVRHYNLSLDAMAITVCHEVGHIIGGYPKVMPTQKYSSEGQSDYFATNDCIRKYFNTTPNNEFSLKGIGQKLIDKCAGERLCLRGLAAIRDDVAIHNGSGDINHTSAHISSYTIFNDYPKGQCRLDTMKAGLFNEARPACWFKDFQTERYEYEEDYIYEEGQGVAEITQVTSTSFGCHIRTAYPDYWMGSYFNPLSESELMMRGVNVIGPCPYRVGETLSGSITLFKKNLYLNLNPTDK